MSKKEEFFSFPLLYDSEIAACLKQLRIPVSEEQLKQPTPEMATQIYQDLLNMFTGWTPEENAQMQFIGVEVFEYPQLHDQSVAQLNFFRSLSKLAQACGITQFAMRDIYNPEPHRLRQFLSGVINFVKFREEKVALYDELVENMDTVTNLKMQVEEENKSLTVELEKHKAKRAEEQGHVEALSSECSRLQQQVRDYNTEQMELKKKSNDVKSQRIKLSDKLASDQFTLLGLNGEKSKLQSQIVQSPERAKQELRQLRLDVDSDTAEAAECEQRTGDFNKKIDGLAKVHKDISKLLKTLQEIGGDEAKSAALKQEIRDLQDRVVSLERENGEWNLKEQGLKKQAKTLKERSMELENKHRVKEEAVTRDMANATKAQKDADKENRVAREELENIESKKRGIGQKMAERQRQHNEQTQILQTEVNKLLAELNTYHRALSNAMQACESS